MRKSGFNGAPKTGNLDSRSAVKKFRAAAKAYTRIATKTKATAVKTLAREGILSRSGRLSKRYAAKT